LEHEVHEIRDEEDPEKAEKQDILASGKWDGKWCGTEGRLNSQRGRAATANVEGFERKLRDQWGLFSLFKGLSKLERLRVKFCFQSRYSDRRLVKTTSSADNSPHPQIQVVNRHVYEESLKDDLGARTWKT
jgi:hypothetical protein